MRLLRSRMRFLVLRRSSGRMVSRGVVMESTVTCCCFSDDSTFDDSCCNDSSSFVNFISSLASFGDNIPMVVVGSIVINRASCIDIDAIFSTVEKSME